MWRNTNNNFFRFFSVNWMRSQTPLSGNRFIGNIEDLNREVELLKNKIGAIFSEPVADALFNGEDIKQFDTAATGHLFVNDETVESKAIRPVVDIDEVLQYYRPKENSGLTPTQIRNIIATTGNFSMKEHETELVKKLENMDKQQRQERFPYEEESGVVYITPQDIHMMSASERSIFKTLGALYGITIDGGYVTMAQAKQVVDSIVKRRGETEANYILALLFPEKLEGSFRHLNPFPMPIFTFPISKVSSFRPNSRGNFVISLGCFGNPTFSNSGSNFWYCNHEDLDGFTQVTDVNKWTQISDAKIPNGFFTGSLTMAAKIKLTYSGRTDMERGLLFAGVLPSIAAYNVPDTRVSRFNDVIKSGIHGCVAPLSDGMHVIYLPIDISHTQFCTPDQNPIGTLAAISSRMVVGMWTGESGNVAGECIKIELDMLINTHVEPLYSDIMKADYGKRDRTVEMLAASGELNRSSLATFTNTEAQKLYNYANASSLSRKHAYESWYNSQKPLDIADRTTPVNYFDEDFDSKLRLKIAPENKKYKYYSKQLYINEGNSKKDKQIREMQDANASKNLFGLDVEVEEPFVAY